MQSPWCTFSDATALMSSLHVKMLGVLTDSQILARAHAMGRFVLTHDADFGSLAMHRGEPLTGIVYLRPGGRPPAQVMADLQALLEAEIDWKPSVIAVYRTGRLRLRRPAEEA